jgi:hypothetical protein
VREGAEIGHLPQIAPAHSARGVMGGRIHGDYVGAASGRFRFTTTDIAPRRSARTARSTLELSDPARQRSCGVALLTKRESLLGASMSAPLQGRMNSPSSRW